MKRAIHSEMESLVANGLYEKTLVDVGAGNHAFLYLPTGSDPNEYTPRTRQDVKPAGNVLSLDDDDDDDDDDDAKGEEENRSATSSSSSATQELKKTQR